MKALVLETRGREAAILVRDGTVRRVRGRYRVGEEIDYVEPAKASVLQWVAAILVAVILLTGSAGMWIGSNYIAYAEVSIDVNPSIVYTLNRRNRVLSVSAANDDAQAIVETLQKEKLRFTPIADAVERTMDVLTDEGYLDSTSEDYVLMSVSADNEKTQEALQTQVQIAIDHAMKRDPTLDYEIEITDRATAKAAREQNMSPGRYAAWQREDAGAAPERYREMPVWQIMGRDEPKADPREAEAQLDNAPTDFSIGSPPAQSQAAPSGDNPLKQSQSESNGENPPAQSRTTSNGGVSPAQPQEESGGGDPPAQSPAENSKGVGEATQGDARPPQESSETENPVKPSYNIVLTPQDQGTDPADRETSERESAPEAREEAPAESPRRETESTDRSHSERPNSERSESRGGDRGEP